MAEMQRFQESRRAISSGTHMGCTQLHLSPASFPILYDLLRAALLQLSLSREKSEREESTPAAVCFPLPGKEDETREDQLALPATLARRFLRISARVSECTRASTFRWARENEHGSVPVACKFAPVPQQSFPSFSRVCMSMTRGSRSSGCGHYVFENHFMIFFFFLSGTVKINEQLKFEHSRERHKESYDPRMISFVADEMPRHYFLLVEWRMRGIRGAWPAALLSRVWNLCAQRV
ncbi:hypothetical protein ACLOJK_018188 [Asimina triloba]